MMAGTEFTGRQFSDIYPDGIENHYWNHARNTIILRCLRKSGLAGLTILEIGGGRGIVTRFLHDRGLDITGVELAESEPVPGTKGYFFPGMDAFKLSEEIRKRYSVILLLDVIEHLDNPADFIARIVKDFPNLKYLLITVPARQELWTNYDEYNGHFRRYSINMLRNISPEIEYKEGGYFNHILYPVFRFYALWVKRRNTNIKAPRGWRIALHRMLSVILQLDNMMLPRRWPGTSCIAVYKK